jgi:hypothetical protein
MAKRRSSASHKDLKDDVIRVRVTSEQKEALVDRAARDGLELSGWVRQQILRAAELLPDVTDRKSPPRGGHK